MQPFQSPSKSCYQQKLRLMMRLLYQLTARELTLGSVKVHRYHLFHTMAMDKSKVQVLWEAWGFMPLNIIMFYSFSVQYTEVII